jgi:hypothetical protein
MTTNHPDPLPKIDNKRTGIFKSNYHISFFFSAYIIWATETVINWKYNSTASSSNLSYRLRTLAPKRFTAPSAPSPNIVVDMLTVTSSEMQILRSNVLVFMSKGENSTTDTYDHQRLSSPCSWAHRLLQQQTAANVIKLDCYQPQYSQAYSTPRKKPRTARHQALPAVWVQSFRIWSRDDW